MKFKIIFFFILIDILYSQISEHNNQNNYQYILNDIIITGTKQYNKNQILKFIGCKLNKIINLSPKETNIMIQKIWKTNLFSDVSIYIQSIKNNSIILKINLIELKTLNNITILGIPNHQIKQLKKDCNIQTGIQINKKLKHNITKYINNIYINQGCYNNKIYFKEIPNKDTYSHVNLVVSMNKGNYIKIKNIKFKGNHFLSDKILKSIIKYTKKQQNQDFKYLPFNQNDFENNLNMLINKYKSIGFREIKIINYIIKHIYQEYYELTIQIEEGRPYYIGKIEFIGNKYYPDKLLNEYFDHQSGQIYNQEKILQKIYKSDIKNDISTIYSNNGYFLSNINLIEKFTNNNSIDIKLIINEGKRSKWNKIIFSGNRATYDYIINKAMQSFPGNFFSNEDIQQTYFQLSNMPFIEITKIKQNIIPHSNNNTVDIHWKLQEKIASQLQLQGGYGGGDNFVGTIGIVIANLSLNNILYPKKKWYDSLTGEEQTIGFQAQSGSTLKNYAVKFIAPYIVNIPTTISFGINSTIFSNKKNLANKNNKLEQLELFKSTIGVQKILPYLGNLLELYQDIGYQVYKFINYPLHFNKIELNNNFYHNLYYTILIGRTSQGQDPDFPTYGSNFNISLQLTPPYSLLNKINYSNIYDEKNYKYVEYYKLKIKTYWYKKLLHKLILKTGAEFGTLECYNKKLGIPMFERFFVGGSGLLHHRFDGRETITLRGYHESSDAGGVLKRDINPFGGGAIYNKFIIELRYPISKKSNKVYMLTFIEAANTWKTWKEYKPFMLNRTAGIGIRFMMPLLGLVGLDIGYGFDHVIGTEKKYGWKTHLILGHHF